MSKLTRRNWLEQFAAAWGLACGPAAVASMALVQHAKAHTTLGPVVPKRSAPALPLTLHDGRRVTLPQLLNGRLTALQLMFTGCSAICPVQGATFAALQALIQKQVPAAQLLSLSIDPLADDPVALQAWRQKFSAQSHWIAAAPPLAHAQVMIDFLKEAWPPAGNGDRHSAQTYLFDSKGHLAYVCAELASPSLLAQALIQLSQKA